MCGIVGIVGKDRVAERLVEGLRRLEYRGYDSAGIATICNGHIERRRAEGKLDNLARRMHNDVPEGHVGIGHTRWATHGVPNEINAHPHATDKVAVVHNGIIENYRELKAELEAKGRTLASETDTEIVAHHKLIDAVFNTFIIPYFFGFSNLFNFRWFNLNLCHTDVCSN